MTTTVDFMAVQQYLDGERKFEGIIDTKVLTIVGPVESGKTSMKLTFSRVWEGEKLSILGLPEMGAILRRLAFSAVEDFDVPFEVALKYFEDRNYDKIDVHSEVDVAIIDGGYIQNLAHLMTRENDVNAEIRDKLYQIMMDRLVEWTMHFKNSYFLLLQGNGHSKQKAFEETLTSIMCELSGRLSAQGLPLLQILIISYHVVHEMLYSPNMFPSSERFFDNFSQFETL